MPDSRPSGAYCRQCHRKLALTVVYRDGGTWVDRKCPTHGKQESLPSRFSQKALDQYYAARS